MRRLRVRTRDPDVEALSPDEQYVRELVEAYHHFFFHYTSTPLLVIETSQFDPDSNVEALDDLIRQVRTMGRGTQYYVPRTAGSTGVTRRRRRPTAGLRPGVLSSPVMAWFKKARTATRGFEGKGQQQDPRRPVGEMSRLRADHLQQGSRHQPERLPEMRASLPRGRARSPAVALRRRVDRVRQEPGIDRSRCSSSTPSRTAIV